MNAPFAHAPQGQIIPRTEAVIKIWAKASAQERTTLGQMHQHYEHEIQRLVTDEANEPHNIAHTLHGLVDDSVEQTLKNHPRGREVSCKRGCASCCSLYVNITHEEAQLLLIVMERDGIEIGWRKLQRQAQWNLKQWSEQPLAERQCVFLGAGNACRVYEHRPASCRKYMVVSSPKRCDTVKYPGGEVAILTAIEAEFIASAMLGVLDSGSMPRMLLKAKEAMS